MCKAHDYLDMAEKSKLNIYLFTPKGEDVSMSDDGELKDLVVAVKDNISVKDWRLTAGSKILKDYIAPYDATVIKKLRDAKVTFIGKVNMDEFAMGSSTENSAFGATKNPWNTAYVPGGSSGGSAAAIAAGLADVSLGNDTGGSIRQPAAFCGVTGLKPTYGSVSRYGLVALASSLDVIGPLARDAETVERVFKAISGKDRYDQTTIDYQYKKTDVDISKLKIGLPKELWEIDIDPEIKVATGKFVEFFKSKGAKIKEVSMPTLPLALPAYHIILPAEASANLARYDGIRYQYSANTDNLMDKYLNTRSKFGSEVKRRILIGTYALSVGHYDAYYQTASNVRDQVAKEHEDIFKEVDVLLSPTTPTLPFKFGERKDPVEMYKSDLLTVGANLAGVPAISAPIGFSKNNLPVGGQLIAAKTNDNILISLIKQFQKKTDFHTKKLEGDE